MDPDQPLRRAPARILESESPPGWAASAVDDLGSTLADHAHCEKKAAASAIALVNDYPEDDTLVTAMARLAEEEIGHFREVFALLRGMGAALPRDRGDPYVQRLLALLRKSAAERKLDRLLVGALIEARSCERFALLSAELERRGQAELARTFRRLESCEAGHAALFVHLAEQRFGEAPTRQRLGELACAEARIVGELPVSARIH